MLAEAAQGAGSAFERDAAVVLRRVEDAARDVRTVDQDNRRALLDLLRRVMQQEPGPPAVDAPQERSRLIVP